MNRSTDLVNGRKRRRRHLPGERIDVDFDDIAPHP